MPAALTFGLLAIPSLHNCMHAQSRACRRVDAWAMPQQSGPCPNKVDAWAMPQDHLRMRVSGDSCARRDRPQGVASRPLSRAALGPAELASATQNCPTSPRLAAAGSLAAHGLPSHPWARALSAPQGRAEVRSWGAGAGILAQASQPTGPRDRLHVAGGGSPGVRNSPRSRRFARPSRLLLPSSWTPSPRVRPRRKDEGEPLGHGPGRAKPPRLQALTLSAEEGLPPPERLQLALAMRMHAVNHGGHSPASLPGVVGPSRCMHLGAPVHGPGSAPSVEWRVRISPRPPVRREREARGVPEAVPPECCRPNPEAEEQWAR